jgi:hypothetical protein
MGLIDLLPNSNFGLAGQTPSLTPQGDPASTLHREYSINGNPNQTGTFPAPSQLDLDGQTPEKYMDNLPG